jgi:hypothetical protein
LKIMFQLIKDSYGIRKFSKQAVTSLKKNSFQIESPQVKTK